MGGEVDFADVFSASEIIHLVCFEEQQHLERYKRYTITLHTRPNKETCNLKRVNGSESTYGSTQFYFIEGSKSKAFPTSNMSVFDCAVLLV